MAESSRLAPLAFAAWVALLPFTRATVSVSTSVGTSAETSASGELKIGENLYLQGAWESNTGSTRGDISGDLKVKYRFRQFKDLLRGGE